ncbi:MAG TPA: alpha/beta hydrolase [Candidatus Eisenbergiella merdipullorum]|uniref:Alpha/beta hydrolase n=1 Tax=Candidatus Eisenbergiella merdipullorum TaxID=2838553 RepID=A0A9D2IAN8_9FIRM|nr:alpha/beta hydrolase [Candidatus Eisenbergiella merdipullorum]
MKRIVRKEKGLTLTCLLPEGQEERDRSGAADFRPGLIYFHGGQDGLRLPEELLEAADTACICISGEDWNRDLTPWPAEKVFKKGEDFGGKADAYLSFLTEKIIPHMEETLSLIPRFRALAGVSLAGLFSVYAAYRTDLFDRIASISGSLWYDEFLPYLRTHRPSGRLKRAYFSLGDRERKTGNCRMARVEDCTLETVELLREELGDIGRERVFFEYNPGNHFADPEERMEKAFRWLLREE